MTNLLEAKVIANQLGLDDAMVLVTSPIDDNHVLLPLLCKRNGQACELSLRAPGGIVVDVPNHQEPVLWINNGCRITTCAECPRPRLSR